MSWRNILIAGAASMSISTAVRIMMIPATVMAVSCSLNTTMPMASPVSGSRAPRMAVAVDPMLCIATAMVSIDNMVGNRASPITQV